MRRPPFARSPRSWRGRRPWGLDDPRPEPGHPRRSLIVALVLASVSLMLLDKGGAPVADPVRAVAAEVFGPAESGTSTAVRPLVELPQWFRTRHQMDDQIASLTVENQQLRAQVHQSGYEKNRLHELNRLTATAVDLGYALVPAHVVGFGASQSFNDTVTIDAGSDAGLRPDMTVVNGDGLVGRVLRTTPSTSTVLLIVDTDSTVGARIGRDMEMGFLHGDGDLAAHGRLDLELLDQTAVPRKGDTVVTWGSQDTSPYVAGVPIGTVTSVYTSLRDSTQKAYIAPFVDFSALDLVGVVVPSGTTSDRQVIEADGSIR